ncbi:hypothetical protein BVC80_293g2 [Macleaya cordata]|uniref:Stomatal closure-related actin-binding protein n=1 Tax=Macleaya cordata TaxID=56857 RepID=A0A200QN62_MACCD|nr:hypothetical protein BVC80_293g2 [Macleaya cordata]
MKNEVFAREKRLSVRDLADKFEKGLSAADGGANLSDEAKLRELVLLEKHVLLEKLTNALESLRGRVTGRNKDDVEDTISMVADLAVKLSQSEGELFEETEQVKKLANFLKQASEDTKRLVAEETAFARNEIESARAALHRVEEALQEQENISRTSGNLGFEDLMKEVQEARRIKMLHQPSKVMEMELELQALRIQLADKSMYSHQLQKELAMSQGHEENESHLYELDGPETLGSYLCITPCTEKAPDLSKCSIQWYRISSEGREKERISGATKSVYASEPFDVGQILQADIVLNDERITVQTAGPITPAPGLGSYVEALVRKPETEFNVVVIQMNGKSHPLHSIHVFHVGKMRIKLSEGRVTKAKESYSTSMQLCGIRGGGNAAAQALFWQAKEGLSFVLAFESDRERNAAIMLARRFAFDWSPQKDPNSTRDSSNGEHGEESHLQLQILLSNLPKWGLIWGVGDFYKYQGFWCTAELSKSCNGIPRKLPSIGHRSNNSHSTQIRHPLVEVFGLRHCQSYLLCSIMGLIVFLQMISQTLSLSSPRILATHVPYPSLPESIKNTTINCIGFLSGFFLTSWQPKT